MLTLEQIDKLLPEADGEAETNKVYIGRGEYEYDLVDAWSRPLVVQIARAIEALVRAECVPQWQPIETAPKDGDAILLWGKFWNGYDEFKRPMIGGWHANDDRWVVFGELKFGVRPTHWMPLPAAPSTTPKEPT